MKDFIKTLNFEIDIALRQRLDSEWSSEVIPREKLIVSFSRLYFPLEGMAKLIHHGREYELRPNNLYLIPPYSALEVTCPDFLIKYWTHFNAYILNSNLDIFSVQKTIYQIAVDNVEETITLFRRMCKHYHTAAVQFNLDIDPLAKLESNSALTLLLLPFLRQISGNYLDVSPESATMFDRLFDFIEKNLSQPLTLEVLAEKVNVNPTYLTNLFAKKFGMPLIQYCNRLRIRRATNLLLNKKYTIEEIAYKVGAKNPKVFSRLFKRHTGLTPSEHCRQTFRHMEESAIKNNLKKQQ